MKTTDLKVGQKFESGIERKDGSIEFYGTIYTIYQITDKRVCYTSGDAHYCGSTNTLKSGLWVGIDRFKKQVETGKIIFK